jgi:hypothetical protein
LEAAHGPARAAAEPRWGAWHWSENKSDESFAVSLCIRAAPLALSITRTLFKRLRAIERQHMPLIGSIPDQLAALEGCVRQAGEPLQAMRLESVLAEERRMQIARGEAGSLSFTLGPRARLSLRPLQATVGGRELAIEDDAARVAVLRAVAEIGDRFNLRDLAKAAPGFDPDTLAETVAWLVAIGFLDVTTVCPSAAGT